MKNKIKICMAQIEVIPADPQKNMAKMLEAINQAKSDKADIIVFPELCIPGYLLGDLWEQQSFLEECYDCQQIIIGAAENITIIFGNVTIDHNAKNEDGRIRRFNSLVIAQNRLLQAVVIKTLQPNYREFDDNRHFYDARKFLTDSYMFIANYAKQHGISEPSYGDFIDDYYSPKIEIHGIKIGCMLCEDGWDTDYSFSPFETMAKKCDMFINISCSPYTHGKNNKRNRVFGQKALKHMKPIVYVNNIGVQNNGKSIYTFDGNSCIYDLQGNQLNPFVPFTECVKTLDINIKEPFGNPNYQEKDDIKMIHDALVYGMQKFCEQIGIKKIIIGISGGIDSAVVTALFAEFMPPENILLINMPSQYNSDTTINAAFKLAENTKCNYKILPIKDSVNWTETQINETGYKLTPFMMENVQARDRSSRILAAMSAAFGGVFTCNANKSEITIGYTTLYGDSCGFMAPIADLWKTQVYELAKYINTQKGYHYIPEESIKVKPSAELSSNQDVTKGMGDPLIYEYHDCLFASWVERWNRATPEDILKWLSEGKLEEYIAYKGKVIDLFKSPKEFIEDLEKWWNLFNGLALCKRVQAPPILSVSRRSYGLDLKESIGCCHYTQNYIEIKQKILKVW